MRFQELRLDPNRLIITVRPQADTDPYHDPQSEVLFRALIDRLRRQEDAQTSLFPERKPSARNLSPSIVSAGSHSRYWIVQWMG